jgi:hypothetical protein
MDILSSESSRTLAAPPESARRAVLESLSAQGFTIDRSQGSSIEAHLGARLLPKAGTLRATRARISVIGDGAGSSRVHITLSDGEQILFDASSAVSDYQRIFERVLDGIDHSLRALDPHMNVGAPDSLQLNQERASAVGQLGRLGQRLRDRPGMKSISADHVVRLNAPDAVVTLTDDEVQQCLAVASMATTDPLMPPPLAHRIDRLARDIRSATRDPLPTIQVTVEFDEKRVLDFIGSS